MGHVGSPGHSPEGDGSPRVLRLFRFRPARLAFDSILRDIMLPDLAGLAGLEDIVVGRRGPGELGDRVIATVWSSRDAMVAGVGDSFDRPVFHPELMEETVERRLEIAPIRFAARGAVDVSPQLVRLVIGRTRPECGEAYAIEAETGTATDIDAGRGPCRLYLADFGSDRFATLSVWGDWSTVGTATGGSIVHPTATRHSDLLLSWEVEHYEMIPDIPQPGE